MIRFVIYWLIAIAWFAVALPIVVLSLFMLEVPLWPTFGPGSTAEGIVLWATVTSFVYLTPLALVFFRKAGLAPKRTGRMLRLESAQVERHLSK